MEGGYAGGDFQEGSGRRLAQRAVKPRRGVAMTHCPNCGLRIIPTPKEFKRWRLDAGLTQREMGQRLKISASFVAYLESGKRSPSTTRIPRYWKFIPA